MYERGDIVSVYFDLPKQRETKTHPAIIISNDSVYDIQDVYLCVMMTSSEQIDKFSFEISDEMTDIKLGKDFQQARCHLVTYIEEKHIDSRFNCKLKTQYVDKLVEHINISALEEE